MQIGIVGLPSSGKTTIFNLLTRGSADVSIFGSARNRPNIGVAKVIDKRVDILSKIFNPQKKIYAEVTYVDVPSPPDGLGKTSGIGGNFLNQLQKMDALLLVLRIFKDPSIVHLSETIDPLRDMETMLYEIIFSDLEIIERRLERLIDLYKGAKPQERQTIQSEEKLLARLKQNLENGIAIRDQEITEYESHQLSGYQFLSAKPAIVVLNYDESQINNIGIVEKELVNQIIGNQILLGAVCGSLEMELSVLTNQEQLEFRESLGVLAPGQSELLSLSLRALDLVVFLTVGTDEVRAWAVKKGTIAEKAAGKIHSDIERGFIRAETVKYQHFIEHGGYAEVRKLGLLRAEGKKYQVQDGDIINFQFNV